MTSPYYAPAVPEWIDRSNRERYNLSYISTEWRTLLERGRYLNTRNHDIALAGKNRKEQDLNGSGRLKLTSDFERLLYTPAGNTAVLGLAKQAIAQSAIELVNDGDTLLVDSGTTALEFVRLLDQRDGITVITADITIADYIDESMPSVDVVMLGGALRKGHRYLYGPLTMQALQMVHADLAVMCPGAFVPGCGFTTDFPQMAETKTAMIGAAHQSVTLMDASKVNGRGMYRFAELTDVDTIVMDRDPDHSVATSIAEATDGTTPALIIAGA